MPPDDRMILFCFILALNKQQIDTTTAIRNIRPSIQNARANFDVDIHKIPSACSGLTLGEYSSTENGKKCN